MIWRSAWSWSGSRGVGEDDAPGSSKQSTLTTPGGSDQIGVDLSLSSMGGGNGSHVGCKKVVGDSGTGVGVDGIGGDCNGVSGSSVLHSA